MAHFIMDILTGGLINVDSIAYIYPNTEVITTPYGEQVPAHTAILPLSGNDNKAYISGDDYSFIRQRMSLI